MSIVLRLAARGDGVTEDGRHVALTAPGDEVAIDAEITPGPHHVTPPCRHFPRCGGCQLQHIDDESYAVFIAERVTGALGAQKIPAPELRPAHLSPPRTRRKASLRAERIGNRVVIGFSEAASHRIVDMQECHVLRPELFALVAPLRTMLLPLLKRGRPVEVGMAIADQGADLLLSGVSPEGLEASEAISAFAQGHGLARLSIDDGYGAQAWWEPAPVTVTLGGRNVALPPGAFLQATQDGEAALVAAVGEAVEEAENVLDLFAGLGTFALPLASRAKVHAAEGARDAALALKVAGGERVTVEHRDLFRRPLDAKELARFDAVVLDPPRAGAKEQAPALAAAGPGRIVYVSCNPATFARDARTLIDGGYALQWVKPVGQFRWSIHVELVALFTR
ncbi:23S rRNA (uracil1939-C5)-methyltransferase [Sphingomonas vulcanisoli]|uniref:23S rRNA (Uracil1939-C5)-methyltransferase n=1 Tax=Sphingomonas vulcanisoli TaxID=1658060 RepID=A0ABX0TLS7_9SPHN|nr:class I SAM-dependent RNA methyltransferase [Sphingomonas vulcanisoli]NIJ06478.1 23S rRNA (uracil1939-C5)-methyltransferase [Sphingomonas vulcanisoli]